MIKYWIRAIFACIAILATTASASAQEFSYTPVDAHTPKIRTEWGVGFGSGYTGFNTQSTAEVELIPNFGFEAHFDMGVRFGRNFALETELSFQGGSIDAKNNRIERRVRTRALDIPLFASLRLVDGMVRIGVGPQFTVMSRGEYTKDSESMIFGGVNPTWNMAASVGVCIARGYLLELRYIHALEDTLNYFEGVEFYSRSYRIAASISILF
jgi:hypothetical protein